MGLTCTVCATANPFDRLPQQPSTLYDLTPTPIAPESDHAHATGVPKFIQRCGPTYQELHAHTIQAVLEP
jgi:hypothetical protein